MKVILLEDVKGHGSEGDTVEVAEGYARNFLFPQHRAIEASDAAMADIEYKRKADARKSKKDDAKSRKLAQSIDGLELITKQKTDGIKLYGSFGPKDVVKLLKAEGHAVKSEWIKLTPVKETGTYSVAVDVPGGFEAIVSVVIEALSD
jgi:large subunit ribosomal protein L9